MAAKYHCEVVAAQSANGTRRCNVCGAIEDVKSLNHDCSHCGGRWDQDVNNTDNLLEAVELEEVTELVTPAARSGDQEFLPSSRRSYRSARAALSKGLPNQ
jgi:transposase